MGLNLWERHEVLMANPLSSKFVFRIALEFLVGEAPKSDDDFDEIVLAILERITGSEERAKEIFIMEKFQFRFAEVLLFIGRYVEKYKKMIPSYAKFMELYPQLREVHGVVSPVS